MSKQVEVDKKKDEIDIGNIKMIHQDCTQELEEYIINSATTALKSYYKGETNYFSDIAKQVKLDIEKFSPGAWHVIVGKSFGSFVTHEVKKLEYFFIGQVGFLIFRHA